MIATKESTTVTRLGKNAQSASYFIYAISTSLLSPEIFAQHSVRPDNEQQIASLKILPQTKSDFSNTTANSSNLYGIIDSRSAVTVIPSYFETELEVKSDLISNQQKEALIPFSLNQGMVLKIANKMFEKSINLSEFEFSVLKKTFKKSIKYIPTLPGRK
jgi:hypothetical protein